jgi:hypothetical protein
MATRREWEHKDGLGFLDSNTNAQETRILSVTGRNCDFMAFDASDNLVMHEVFGDTPSTVVLPGNGISIQQIADGRRDGFYAQFMYIPPPV